jgi:hypothetical protein
MSLLLSQDDDPIIARFERHLYAQWELNDENLQCIDLAMKMAGQFCAIVVDFLMPRRLTLIDI